MTIQQLRCFLQIAQAASRPGGGNSLSLDLRLQALERELCASLVTENRTLTAAGRHLQGQAEALLSHLDQLAADVYQEGLSDVLRVGAVPSMNIRLLPRAALSFRREFPGVRLRVREGSTEQLLSLLRRGELDLCLLREPFDPAGVQSLPIRDPALRPGEEDGFAAAAPARFFPSDRAPLTLEDLWGKPLLILRRYGDALRDACRRRGFVPRTVCESDSPHAALLWAEQGLGMAILPFTAAVLRPSSQLVIRRLDAELPPPPVRLALPSGADLTDEVRTLLRLLQN